MKLFKINIFICCLLLISVGNLSCKKSFFTDVNQNPNAPASVSPALVLSTVEAALGYTQGGDISRYTALLMQQVYGNASQSQAYYQYALNAGTFDNVWPDLYTSVMVNDDTLKNLADEGHYNAYSGVSRILMAYTLQITVDLWGSIPYSQALVGNSQLKPIYDSDKGLYDTIVSLIDVGIAQLSDPDAGALTPGVEDFIYNGDAAKWIKFGHAIKARIYFHQSKGNAAMATKALDEIALSFTSNSENAQYVFGSAETSANPWYQFNEQRPGDITFSNATIATWMLQLNDPRYSIFIDSLNDGSANQSGKHFGGLGDYYAAINSPVELIVYDELLFTKAEAILRTTGDVPSAQTVFQAAIKANMQKLGVADADITTYINAHGNLTVPAANAINQLALQEYIALYLNPEAFTLWRRTNNPPLAPISGNAIPRRLLYPQSELSYNGANTPKVTLFTPKIFWDN